MGLLCRKMAIDHRMLSYALWYSYILKPEQVAQHFAEYISKAFSWKKITLWCHQMETFPALLAICAENSLVTGEFLAQMASNAGPVNWCILASMGFNKLIR